MFEKFSHLFNIENSPNKLLTNIKKIPLLIFLLSNLAYLPAMIKSKSIDLLIVVLVFFISTFYHTVQVFSRDDKSVSISTACCGCMYLDMFIASVGSIIILIKYRKNLNIKIIALLVMSLIIFASHWTKSFGHGYYYLYFHSLWHILTGVIAYLIIK